MNSKTIESKNTDTHSVFIQTNRPNKSLLIFILGSLAALAPFSIDMYLPSFAAIATDLHTSIGQVTLSLSSYFIGMAAGQLLYGPLLDKYGRKKPLYVGLTVYLLASFGCMIKGGTIDSLIALRFIQAVGSCAAGVAAMAMVRDLFPVEENAKVFALLMLVVGASPMVAPTIGGYVTATLGWRAIFLILALLASVILAAVIFILPDTYKPNKSLSLKPRPILNNFRTVLLDPQFFTYAFTGSIAFSGLFAYVAGSPMIFMKVYMVSEQMYGWIFAGLSVGFIGSSQVNNLLMKKFRSEQIIPTALLTQVVIGILFIVCAANNWLNLFSFLAMLFLMLCCVGIIGPNANALSLAPFTQHAGSASSLMGAIQLGIGALASVVTGLFEKPSIVPLAMAMSCSAVVAYIVLFIGRKYITTTVVQSENETSLIH